jgi:hypothetical protein
MDSYVIAYKSVPAIWLQETETGIIYHNDNKPEEVTFQNKEQAIQRVIDDCGILGDIEWVVRNLGPWSTNSNGPDWSWCIVNGSKCVKIGPVGSGRTNYYDRAMKECVRRNAKVHGIKLPEGY